MATVTIELRDSYNRKATRSFESKATVPDDADVVDLADKLADITKMGVTKATVSYEVDISAVATTASDQASRQSDARLEVYKSGRGSTYTFNLPHPKAALTNSDATLAIANAAFTAWVELFDDGLGVGGVAGDWYISDGEEVAEGSGGDNIVRGFLYKD